MNEKRFEASELILNPDGSIYHLHLLPEQIADDIIVVGDPQRVEIISSYFDAITDKITNREFITHTGVLNGKRITALATGIGTDNIDIVMNELDALVNINLKTREIKETKKSLNIIRIGTSGALQPDIPVDSFVFSTHGLGFDGLLNFYKGSEDFCDLTLTDSIIKHLNYNTLMAKPYIVKCSEKLENTISAGMIKGITATASGFYAPQGRALRLNPTIANLNELLSSYKNGEHRITNFEMETSALYGLGSMLGHQTATCCAIIANRQNKTFSQNYKLTVVKLIEDILNKLTS